MAIGIVKNFNKDKGFGFINMEGEERDIFFHYSQLVQEGFKTIDPGQKVEFELVEGDRGLQAHQVVKICFKGVFYERYKKGNVIYYNGSILFCKYECFC
mgnify:CR=1 FL=1